MRQPAASQGFTLLEILVVLVIVAVMTSALGLAARPTESREVEIAGQQWLRAIHNLSGEALMQGEVLGLAFKARDVSVYVWRQQRWQEYERVVDLPILQKHINLSISDLDGNDVASVLPNGELSRFELQLSSTRTQHTVLLRSDGLNVSIESDQ